MGCRHASAGLVVLALAGGGCSLVAPAEEPPAGAEVAIRPGHKPAPPKPAAPTKARERKPMPTALETAKPAEPEFSKPAEPEPSKPAEPGGAKPAEPAPETVQARAPAPPPRLAGIDQDEARRLFGPPAFVTERPPAVIWSYDGPACRLDLTFYMDIAGQRFRSLFHEARATTATGPSGDACVAALRKQDGAAP